MKNKIIYHNKDLDGWCSGAIAKSALIQQGHAGIEMIGWDYGDPLPEMDAEACYILTDISLPSNVMQSIFLYSKGMVWIDHHKSAIEESEKFSYRHCPGVRKIGDSASLLAWKFFYDDDMIPDIVYWVDRYDVWKQGPDWKEVMEMQYGMTSMMGDPFNDKAWSDWMFAFNCNALIETIKQDGEIIYAYQQKQNESACKKAFDLVFEGYNFAALNTPFAGSAQLDSYKSDRHDGLMVFSCSGTEWSVSMYSNGKDIDFSKVAVKYGGGGHASACGFRLNDINKLKGG